MVRQARGPSAAAKRARRPKAAGREARGRKIVIFLFQGYIFCKILWLGGGGEWCRGKKKKNETVRVSTQG